MVLYLGTHQIAKLDPICQPFFCNYIIIPLNEEEAFVTFEMVPFFGLR